MRDRNPWISRTEAYKEPEKVRVCEGLNASPASDPRPEGEEFPSPAQTTLL